MDEGSTVSLIDEELATTLEVKGSSNPLELTGISDVDLCDSNSQVVTFGVSALDNNIVHKISDARTVQKLKLFTQTVRAEDIKQYKHLSNLPIECYVHAKPLILIGQDNWSLIMATQVRHVAKDKPAASLTQLGWVIHGQLHRTDTKPSEDRVFCLNDPATTDLVSNTRLNNLIKFHFTFESLGVTNFKRKNKLENRAEQILASTTTFKENRWETGLPWRNDQVNLPNNRANTLVRLKSIERRMDKDTIYAEKYCKQVDHLIKSGYAEKITGQIPISPKLWYLPHFSVENPNKTTKLRLVFDGAAKFDGTSLNDNLLTGPDLTNSLFGVLIRFRQKKVAVKADIREMFLQIKIREQDQSAQMFLWRGTNRDREPDTYVMTSMLFGTASSPYTAQYVMRKNTSDFETMYPRAVNAIKRNHYVDDYLDSFDSIEEGIDIVNAVSSIHKRGGFEIRDWASNERLLLEKLPETTQNSHNIDLSMGEIPTEKTLGLMWNTSKDTISFNLNLQKIPAEIMQGQRVPTKREMLSIVMAMFDPLGLLMPYTIRNKILLQDVWRSGITWDEQLKTRDFAHWKDWISDLDVVKHYQIPRAYCGAVKVPDDLELHIFSDASDKAYSAVAYLRSRSNQNKVHVAFVAGKAKVAPLKPVSIPRMELQGALLASRLGDSISKELEICVKQRFYWTDSRTVLGWIYSDPRKYQTFVAHRLGEIDELSNAEEWRWTPSKQNPADCATKATGTIKDCMNQWLCGPEFLIRQQSEWPKQTWKERSEEPITEMKREFTGVVYSNKIYESPKITNFSKWLCLVRSTALVLSVKKIWRDHDTKILTADDLFKAEAHLIKKVQQEDFWEEIRAIKNKNPLPKGSRLKELTPIITTDGILKVDGRIKAVKDIPELVKFPIILSGKHHFTRLLVQYYHERFHHGSTEAVVNELRQKYWILKIRPTVKSVILRCQFCRLRNAKIDQPRMGDLPEARLGHHFRPFTFCGVDYFGPMLVTIGRRHEKRWGALFTCLTTRAVHLELVSTLSTDSAIMALQRMSNRRGTPSEIFSDNGTNFTGMSHELKNAIKGIDTTGFQDKLSNMQIKWRFIPPGTPHMGGSWERLVRSVKRSLSTILNERAPKEEVLRTLFTEVEHTVNSRPLTHVSVDSHDQESLTPNHWLIGSSSGSVTWGEFNLEDLSLRKQWRIAQKLADMFWGRWLKEYLPNLVVRKRWNQEVRNLIPGDVVLIVDPNMPRNVWPKGKIVSTYPGKDGRVRVVDVLTRGKVLKRASNRIIVLVPVLMGTEELLSRTEGESC